MIITRRVLAGSAVAAAAFGPACAQMAGQATRPIPSSGERLPVVGIGTARIFDFENDPAAAAERAAVLRTLAEGGGRLIDTAPSYGRAEARLGDALKTTGLRDKLFIATKVTASLDAAGQTRQMRESQQRIGTQMFDLMQAHNVGSADYDIGLLNAWKAEKITRYTGVTTSSDNDYGALEAVLRRTKPDFVQFDYAIDNRNAELRLLPAAADLGIAVLTNLPFGRNRLFSRVQGVALPPFAAEIGATSWAQFFLKFLVSHPAVTAVIPGTDKPEYMTDNLGAGRGPMPDAAMRRRMVAFVDALPPATSGGGGGSGASPGV
jgi:aryl-alcohol dehydrogenase-like predicted oxidoreductase